MKSLSIVKRLSIAAVAAAALAGPVTAVHALQITAGDAVLVLYGNGNEYVRDLGMSASSLISTGADINLSTILPQVGPDASLKYTIFGTTGGSSPNMIFGTTSTASSFGTGATSNAAKTSAVTLDGILLTWRGSLVAAGSPAVNDAIFTNTDSLSFSQNVNGGVPGTDNLGGAISGKLAFATFDSALNNFQSLNLLQKTTGTIPLSMQGVAMLDSTTGHLVVPAAVPLPAAVVLFGTGVIGLVGLARRRVLGFK